MSFFQSLDVDFHRVQLHIFVHQRHFSRVLVPILIVVDNDMSMENNEDFVEDVNDRGEGKEDEDGEDNNEHLFIVSSLAAMLRLLASVESYVYYLPPFPTSVSQITLAS